MPQEPGERKRKLPERADNLRVDLPFEEALKAAVATKPPAPYKKKPKQKKPAAS
jgi:hypothetical protein